jgi:transcriptional regulator with XRE-family HTH domain
MEAPHKSGSEQVAAKLMSLRQALGMSASEFASQLGISGRRLNRIDRGESRIPLDLLLHACRKFRKPKEYFLASLIPERPYHFVLRANEIRRILRSTRTTEADGCFGKVVSRPLADGFQNRGMHPQLLRLTELHGRSPRLLQHPGQEFVYVLTGKVDLLTRRDNELFTETLFPGDSCFIDSSVAHRFLAARLNPYQRPGAEILTILWVPVPGA